MKGIQMRRQNFVICGVAFGQFFKERRHVILPNPIQPVHFTCSFSGNQKIHRYSRGGSWNMTVKAGGGVRTSFFTFDILKLYKNSTTTFYNINKYAFIIEWKCAEIYKSFIIQCKVQKKNEYCRKFWKICPW